MRCLLLLALLLMGCSETGNTTDPWAENKESIRDTMWVAVDSAQYKSLLEKQDSVLASLVYQRDSMYRVLEASVRADSIAIRAQLDEALAAIYTADSVRSEVLDGWKSSMEDSLAEHITSTQAIIDRYREDQVAGDSLLRLSFVSALVDSLESLKDQEASLFFTLDSAATVKTNVAKLIKTVDSIRTQQVLTNQSIATESSTRRVVDSLTQASLLKSLADSIYIVQGRADSLVLVLRALEIGAAQESGFMVGSDTVYASDSLNTTAHPSGWFRDSRDMRRYKYVTVGTQVWMAQNINYRGTVGVTCPANDTLRCASEGGRYTTYSRGYACPAGWSVPKSTRVDTLFASTVPDTTTVTLSWKKSHGRVNNSTIYNYVSSGVNPATSSDTVYRNFCSGYQCLNNYTPALGYTTTRCSLSPEDSFSVKLSDSLHFTVPKGIPRNLGWLEGSNVGKGDTSFIKNWVYLSRIIGDDTLCGGLVKSRATHLKGLVDPMGWPQGSILREQGTNSSGLSLQEVTNNITSIDSVSYTIYYYSQVSYLRRFKKNPGSGHSDTTFVRCIRN